ncbi:AAA family ATPase [Candidatus Pelagibacter sp.]|nr:AAA family ATPase [Candidatus Pelagibacter sp.]
MSLIEINHKNQTKLHGYDKFFKNLTDLYIDKKLPKKIILSGPKGIGKSTLSYHLVNYIFSADEKNKYDVKNLRINDTNRSFNLVKNNSHPNFFLIDTQNEKKNIDIEQIRQMINFCNKSSFNNHEKIVLINNLDKLNKNSVNALLKIVEEPNNNIYFILILDSNKTILKTLKSRCIKFNLFLTFEQSIDVVNKITGFNIFDLINNDLLHYYNTPGHYIKLINFSKKYDIDLKETSLKKFLILLIDNSYYKKDDFIDNCIYQYLEFYLLKIMNINNSSKLNFFYKRFIEKIFNMHKYNLDKESFFIEFKTKIFNG